MARIETDVLIVGAGPAGASLGCFLTKYGMCASLMKFPLEFIAHEDLIGVTGLIISKASSTVQTPRSHYTNNATFGMSCFAIEMNHGTDL
jgi:alkyl hydroperoxide reductase subunit AhpF